jgi:hypothetical protein
MRSNITQLIIGTAVAFGMSVVAVTAIGSAVAQAPVELVAQDALTNRPEALLSETDFRLSDRQQLRGFFLRDRLP